jgi:DNA-binding transcriptional regulator YiaG
MNDQGPDLLGALGRAIDRARAREDRRTVDHAPHSAEIDGIVATLIAERQRQGLSQRDITRRLGTSSASMSIWERGISSPTLSHLREWARALGLDVVLTTVAPPGVRTDAEDGDRP